MSEQPTASPNPFTSPVAASAQRSTSPKRPVGAIVLAILLLLGGIGVAAARCIQLSQAFSQGATVTILPAYYVALAKDVVTSTTGILAAVTLLMGKPLGWWTAIFHCYWRLSIQVVLPIVGLFLYAPVAQVAGLRPEALLQLLFSGGLIVLAVFYLLRLNVVAYYRVLPSQRLVANVIVVVASFVLACAFDIWWAVVQ